MHTGNGGHFNRRDNKSNRARETKPRPLPPRASRAVSPERRSIVASTGGRKTAGAPLTEAVFTRRRLEPASTPSVILGFAPGTEHLAMHRAVPDLVRALSGHRAAVLDGMTGTGKSLVGTLALYANRGMLDAEKIVLVVPRRAVANVLAHRLADITSTKVGELIGYTHGLDRMVSPKTRILVTTNGSQLMRELRNPSDSRVIMFMDEFHELSAELELLSGLMRLRQNRDQSGPKIVGASATSDFDKMSRHFWKAPRVSIQGKQFSVAQRPAPKGDSLAEILDYMPSLISEAHEEGKNTIVVVPRKRDIDDLTARVLQMCPTAEIYPFHGGLSDLQRAQALGPYRQPAVVIATNLIQTSITVPDADLVIASGWVLRMRVDRDGVVHLCLEHSTNSEIQQQFGRVGRTKDGWATLCGVPAEKRDYEVPSGLQTSRLDSLYLQLYGGREDLRAINPHCLHPASERRIQETESRLQRLGLLGPHGHLTEAGRFIKGLEDRNTPGRAKASYDTNLTECDVRGEQALPISPHLGKILYQAHLSAKNFTSILENAIDVVAVAEEQEPIASGDHSTLFRKIGFVPSSWVVAQGALLSLFTNEGEKGLEGLEINSGQIERVILRRARLREIFKFDPKAPTPLGIRDSERALTELHNAVQLGYITGVFVRNRMREDGPVTYSSPGLKGEWILSRESIDHAPQIVVGEPRRIDYLRNDGEIGTLSVITQPSTVTWDWIKNIPHARDAVREALKGLRNRASHERRINRQRQFRRPRHKKGPR